jgi:hypothetical protein
MKRFLVLASLCILGSPMMAVAHPASADVRINANLSSGRIYLDTEPNVVLVPGTQVYYSPYGSYEVFRYRNRWFVNQNGMWYRASSYRGPFIEVPDDRVPRQVMSVPVEYRQQYRNQNQGWYNHHHRYHRNNGNNDYNNNNNNGYDNNYHHHQN